MTTAPGGIRRLLDRLGVQFALWFAIALLPLGLIAIVQTQAVIREAQGRSAAALMGVTLRAAAASPPSICIGSGTGAGGNIVRSMGFLD